MNNPGELHFFGTPRAVGESGNHAFAQGNFLWLLTYLAVQNDWVDRKELAALLWPDVSAQSGLNNLRQLLHRHKNLAWAQVLETQVLEANAQAIRISGETDVSRFRRAVSQADWQVALRSYSGPLLEGVRPLGVEAFETWLEAERAVLQNDWREALIGWIQVLEVRGDAVEMFDCYERLLGVDPHNEEAVLALLQLAQRFGQQALGLKQFQLFRQRLRADLGVDPLHETQQAADLLAGKPEVAAVAHTDALLGRDAEQTLILEQLNLVRLLNVRGTGGVGKTVLAKRVFELAASGFVDGAFWVALQPISKLADVPLALAAALDFSLNANGDVWTQLGELLHSKNSLLVLDNCEHLPGLPEKIADLLEATLHLKILVTSRVSLELPNESVVTLEGLDYPTEANLGLLQSSNAARLFVLRAAKRKAGFALSEQNKTAIWRICQLVRGSPLGLALAAAWVSELSPEALADGLESNADLAVALEGESMTHQSLRMVFEHSWELLEDDLRLALSGLSVFRGGFERRAALEGLGLSARALLALVGRSLLQSLPGGRYDLHPVVQAFAAQKLERSQLQELQLAHARYFTQFAENAEKPLRGGANQARFLKQITADLLNYLAAIQWTAAHDTKLGAKMVGDLVHFWYSSGHRREGLDWANQFLTLHQAPDTVRLRLLWTKASLSSELAEYDVTTTALEAHEQLVHDHSGDHELI